MSRVGFLLLLAFFGGGVRAQFPGASLFSVPWGQQQQQQQSSGSYPLYGKPIRPSPFGYGTPTGNYGRPPGNAGSNSPVSYDDDPVPVPSSIESAFEPPQFPARLPIRAPNGVVEIYNRVVDDLITKLRVDFEKAELDPMSVVIRSTPPGPVRVPGHLQKRPFRRPGAALYRSNKDDDQKSEDTPKSKKRVRKTEGASESQEEGDDYGYRFGRRGETPRSNGEDPKTNTKAEEKISEILIEPTFDEYPRSDENFSEEIPVEEVKPTPKPKPKRRKPAAAEDEETEDDETAETEGKNDDDQNGGPLLQNRKGEAGNKKNKDVRYKSGNVTVNKKEEDKPPKQKPAPPDLEEEPEEDPPSQEDEDEEEDFDDHEPGTLQSAGNRPLGGYYPHDGAPVVPSKPNAELRGLASMVRASDVVVGVDARSAIITARLLVGPLTVNINSSAEPLERGVKAVIPELEAEMILMERHGVIFLQRFTLDRVYGQDVEISVPKVKTEKKKKGGTKSGTDLPYDPMHPGAVQRYQTKMGAHLSMEVVKLLRSGNLRLQIMRAAQGAMTKIRLPIKTTKTSKKRSRKNKKKTKSQRRRAQRE